MAGSEFSTLFAVMIHSPEVIFELQFYKNWFIYILS